MFYRIKNKAFGLIESVIASLIVIVVLSAAVALSSGSIKTAELNSSYLEAQHISESIFESINLIKSSGSVYFDSTVREDGSINIDCFDSEYYNTHNSCKLIVNFDKYPFTDISFLNSQYRDGYYLASSEMLDNPSFPDEFFSYKTEVSQPDNCYTSNNIKIPDKKCRIVLTDIKWTETSGEKHYRQGMYLTDWER